MINNTITEVTYRAEHEHTVVVDKIIATRPGKWIEPIKRMEKLGWKVKIIKIRITGEEP